MLAALDPMGMPVATDVVPGQRADEPLYVPAMTRVRASLERRGLLYVGDCKMGALETRAFLHAGGDYYLCPLSALQVPPEVLEGYVAPVWTGQQRLRRIYRTAANGKRHLVAEGYEQLVPLTAEVGGESLRWTERRLVIRSRQLAQAGERGLRARLTKAQAAVEALTARRQGKVRLTQRSACKRPWRRPCAGIGSRACWTCATRNTVQERPVRRYRDRPACSAERAGGAGAHARRPGSGGCSSAPAGLARVCDHATRCPTLPGAGCPGLSERVSHRAGHGTAERAALVPDPNVSGARRPCDRIDPAAVDWVACADRNLRTRIKRLMRRTICFSKTERMHDLVIGLFINRYEFGRPL